MKEHLIALQAMFDTRAAVDDLISDCIHKLEQQSINVWWLHDERKRRRAEMDALTVAMASLTALEKEAKP